MSGLLEAVFWLCVAYLGYVEVGYPALLWLVARLRRPAAASPAAGDGASAVDPSVTLIIAAHNEARVIRARLDNALALDYPRERLQVLVASDGSTDGTDAVVLEYASRGVGLVSLAARGGKVAALRAAEVEASGEVIVISDADSQYERDALRLLVRHLANPHTGAVSGHEIRRAVGARGTGEGFYCRLDNAVKALEGRIGSQVMVNGGFFAIRRDLMPHVPDHLTHDGVVPPTLVLQGYRTAYEPKAISREDYALDSRQDFRRRVRTVLQALQSYWHVRAALNPFRTGLYAVQVLSHRFLRWLVFPVLAVALAASVLLAWWSRFYLALAVLQATCYVLAFGGFLIDRRERRPAALYFPFYFVYVHLAAFLAVLMAVRGKQIATWRPTQRTALHS